MWDGLLCCVIASAGFGSAFVPMRRIPMGDGYFAQLFFCLGGFLIVYPVGFYYPPKIYPLVMLGAALWCFGNSFCVMLMNRVGMAQGMLIWNIASCLTGWATSRFGLFGVIPQLPESLLLNYVGVILLLVGATGYLFIKSTLPPPITKVRVEDEKKFDKEVEEIVHHVPRLERLIAMFGCLGIGILFGSFYTPVAYLQSRAEEGFPTSGMEYIFSFFIGVVPATFTIFIAYCYVKKAGDGSRYGSPAFYGGLIFGAAMCFFMIANEKLSATVAYPIMTMLPGFVVSLWSVLYFKEITGNRNLTLLSVAYALTLVGVAVITASKSISL